MGEIRLEIILMTVGISLAIVGAVSFTVMAILGDATMAGAAAWGCGAATAIYCAALARSGS